MVFWLIRLRPLLRSGGVREGRRARKVLPLVRLRPLLRSGGVREGRRAWKVPPLIHLQPLLRSGVEVGQCTQSVIRHLPTLAVHPTQVEAGEVGSEATQQCLQPHAVVESY